MVKASLNPPKFSRITEAESKLELEPVLIPGVIALFTVLVGIERVRDPCDKDQKGRTISLLDS